MSQNEYTENRIEADILVVDSLQDKEELFLTHTESFLKFAVVIFNNGTDFSVYILLLLSLQKKFYFSAPNGNVYGQAWPQNVTTLVRDHLRSYEELSEFVSLTFFWIANSFRQGLLTEFVDEWKNGRLPKYKIGTIFEIKSGSRLIYDGTGYNALAQRDIWMQSQFVQIFLVSDLGKKK